MTNKNSQLAVVVLAAGLGKRMNNPDLPKVLAELHGKPLIGYVMDTVKSLQPDKAVIVVGHHKEKVIDYVRNFYHREVSFVEQAQQLGTGHAVNQAAPVLENFNGDVLILCGDVPLLKVETLIKFLQLHQENNSDISDLSAILPVPKGYGRIVRDSQGNFLKIVEEKDADDEIKKIQEINSGVFIVSAKKLFGALKQVSNTNAQGEYYLTDIISILKNENARVFAFPGADFKELQGINTNEDLKNIENYIDGLYINDN
jgi:bifunctional UDP-N-acetylglucosamine pyrophosphorylase/glucosamine-1-phosphate N-acetyltransferase